MPAEDLAAARAAGPVKRTYGCEDRTTVKDLLDHLLTPKRPRRVHVRRPDGEFTLSRDH